MLPTLFFSRCDRWLQDGTPVVSCVIFTENRRIGTIVGREQTRQMVFTPELEGFRFSSFERLMDAKQAVRDAVLGPQGRAPLAA